MKLQVQGQAVRIRLSEDELATLLTHGRCSDVTSLGTLGCWQRELVLVPSLAGGLVAEGDAWSLHMPRAAFEAFASERPRRDGFLMPAGTCAGLDITVEVDVRDSRKRMPRSASIPSGS